MVVEGASVEVVTPREGEVKVEEADGTVGIAFVTDFGDAVDIVKFSGFDEADGIVVVDGVAEAANWFEAFLEGITEDAVVDKLVVGVAGLVTDIAFVALSSFGRFVEAIGFVMDAEVETGTLTDDGGSGTQPEEFLTFVGAETGGEGTIE